MPQASSLSVSFIAALLVLLLVGWASASVQVVGRRLLVDGQPFFMKGVAYYPIPIGYSPDQKYEQYTNSSADRAVWMRDFDALEQINCNTIRMYGFNNDINHTAFFDEALKRGIRVILQYWFPTDRDLSNPTVRTQLLNEWRTMIINQQHPAVIMWLFHNELNLAYPANQLDNIFSLVADARDVVIDIEGPNHRPVSTTVADINVTQLVEKYDDSVDVWCMQIYRGRSFGSLFADYATRSTKPLFITEHGVDAYDSVNNREDQQAQAEYAENLWKEMIANSSICSGGAIFAYVDEWWKCPGGSVSAHESCPNPNPNFPDGYATEEWFGIFSANRAANENEPDVHTARWVTTVLKNLWALNPYEGLDVPLNPSPASGPSVATSTPNSASFYIPNFSEILLLLVFIFNLLLT